MSTLFDRFLESFSHKDLSRRVKAVVIIGIGISLLIVAAGYVFLTSIHVLSVRGPATWSPEGELEITLDEKSIALLTASDTFDAVLMARGERPVHATLHPISIEPTTGQLLAKVEDIPQGVRDATSLEVQITVDKRPYWKMLWGRTP